jgi:dipeptidyl aminopeptidase/acylaminoacyl peptidase
MGMQFWIYGRTLLPAKGYALLSPNYRGSTGYGDKFLIDLVGRENDIEVTDILKGVDFLIEEGIADPDRLGVMGWSNGGYLTNCILTKTTRFKAASSGAGIVDSVMEFGSNDEPAYPLVFNKGFPWTTPEIYHRSSATYQLDKIRTPTLIHVGGNDERCPPAQSRFLHRVLKEYLKVPTELLVYPGEPHGLTKYKNRKAKMEWDLAWFDKYIRK